MLNASHEIVYSPAEQVLLPQPWYVGRALLIGDAAHAGMPHLAQGAAMALEDAYVLDELVGRQLPAPVLMESFMQRRYERCLYSQRASLAIANSEQHSDFTALSKHHDHLRESLPGHLAKLRHEAWSAAVRPSGSNTIAIRRRFPFKESS